MSAESTTKEHSTIQQLRLHPHQLEHFQRVMEILSRFYFYIDGSEMGTGKTYIAAAVAIATKLPCIVVCPLAARNTWKVVFSTYGVKVYNLPDTGGILTYSSLRSRKGCQPKHGLLTRDDSGKTIQFYPTTLLSQIVQAGVMLIFDECQNLKNASDQHKAVRAMVHQFYNASSRSRVAFLSGTFLDKKEQIVNFMRMVGFIASRNLYSKIQGKIRLEGVDDLHNWARRINADETRQYIENNPFKSTQSGSIEYTYNLFLEVIRPGIMSIMPRQEMNAMKDIKNGYYFFPRSDETEYLMAEKELSEILEWNVHTNEISYSKDNMGSLINAMVRLQKAKTTTMIRVAKEILNKNTTDSNGNPVTPKVILFADYYIVIDRIMNEMAEFNPIELTGRLSEGKRNENVSLFQESNSKHRLLVGNPLVGGLSVDLHDTTGKYPRTMIIMPNYRINELHQATGRIFRSGTVGVAKIRFFYGVSGTCESSILSALARKGKVMKTLLKEQSENGVKFPDEYESEKETSFGVK